jgi:hypothetical protein
MPAMLAWAGETFSFALSFALFGAAMCAAGALAVTGLRIPDQG